MKTPAEVIEFLGADRVALALGVSRRRVQNAVAEGEFPALWYDALERLAGRPLRREMFSFKPMREGVGE